MARIVLDDDSELDEYVRRYLEDCVQRQVRGLHRRAKALVLLKIHDLRLEGQSFDVLFSGKPRDNLAQRRAGLGAGGGNQVLRALHGRVRAYHQHQRRGGEHGP